ncbi:MAG: Rpn family recombination-promoting nuclease/putative transposase [Eubacterium sp.]|nr:Rpn family recombination-promoting nuclease/putative transposase [Eubacterium sp.]
MFSENTDLLHDLLASLLEIPQESIKNIAVKNSEILPERLTGKFVRLDLNVQVDEKLINVEMQMNKESDYKDRVLFYWSKMYSGELKQGDEFNDLKQSISINILNFNMFDCPEYHSSFTIMEKTRHEILNDKFGIHFFELKKISKQANRENNMELWLQLINAETEEEFEMLEQTGIEPIKKAVYVIHKMSDDEKVQELARLREKAEHNGYGFVQ